MSTQVLIFSVNCMIRTKLSGMSCVIWSSSPKIRFLSPVESLFEPVRGKAGVYSVGSSQ